MEHSRYNVLLIQVSSELNNFLKNKIYGPHFKLIEEVSLNNSTPDYEIDETFKKIQVIFKSILSGNKFSYSLFTKDHLSYFVKTVSRHDSQKCVILNDAVLHRVIASGKSISPNNTLNWIFPKKQINSSIELAKELDRIFKQFLVVLSAYQSIEMNKDVLNNALINQHQPYFKS